MVQDVLKQCTVEGMVVKLPAGQLDRKDYVAVKKSLELIGGKWTGGKTQGFVFEQDPAELLKSVAEGEQRNLKKEFQFFATPEAVALQMLDLISWVSVKDQILEPSAGNGALINALVNTKGVEHVDCFEIMELNRIKLNNIPAAHIVGHDFLECELKDWYDVVIANPPFTNNQDIDHIAKMWQVVKPGGVIVTLTSTSWAIGSQKKQLQFKEWLNDINAEQYDIEEGAFKESGTNVRTVLLKIVKPVIYHPVPWADDATPKKTRTVPKAAAPLKSADSKQPAEQKVRSCRVCGCTDNNCSQCIEKTGSPCHWVETDLCSACVEPKKSEEILQDLVNLNKEITKETNELQQMLTTNNTDMNFFRQLFQMGNVDLSMRVMQKNSKLTISIEPGLKSAGVAPIIVTGTPEELDAEFFASIAPAVQEIKGIVSNITDVKKQAETKAGEKKNVSVAKAADKAVDKKHAAKKKTEAKANNKRSKKPSTPQPVEASMFDEEKKSEPESGTVE